MLEERRESLSNFEPAKLDSVIRVGEHEECLGHVGSGSGGYLHHVLVHAAKELHGVTLDTIEMTVKKGDDHKEATVVVDGEVKLRFATAYGFRHIQNTIRRVKRGKCPHVYIEIMACPKGCVNGEPAEPLEGPDKRVVLLKWRTMMARRRATFT